MNSKEMTKRALAVAWPAMMESFFITLLLVFVFHMGLMGVWLGVLSDQASRFILMSHRFRRGEWVNLRI